MMGQRYGRLVVLAKAAPHLRSKQAATQAVPA